MCLTRVRCKDNNRKFFQPNLNIVLGILVHLEVLKKGSLITRYTYTIIINIMTLELSLGDKGYYSLHLL